MDQSLKTLRLIKAAKVNWHYRWPDNEAGCSIAKIVNLNRGFTGHFTQSTADGQCHPQSEWPFIRERTVNVDPAMRFARFWQCPDGHKDFRIKPDHFLLLTRKLIATRFGNAAITAFAIVLNFIAIVINDYPRTIHDTYRGAVHEPGCEGAFMASEPEPRHISAHRPVFLNKNLQIFKNNRNRSCFLIGFSASASFRPNRGSLYQERRQGQTANRHSLIWRAPWGAEMRSAKNFVG